MTFQNILPGLDEADEFMHDALKLAMSHLLDNRRLSADLMKQAMDAIMEGQCSEAEVASLLTALRCRGESVGELVGAARAMRERSTPIICRSQGLLDTCGTGGDQLHTFNISTAAALVAAAAGQPVAKHGNRSATSTSGSADVLEALGVNLQLTAEQIGDCIDEVGIGFCFAPLLHSAMKHVAPVRKQLGFRTIFNLLGPLTNPARASYQLLGATRTTVARDLAHALCELGSERALVVCGNNELDEVSLWGETAVFEVSPSGVVEQVWTAELLGLPTCQVESLRVEGAGASADIIRGIFAGKAGPARDIVVANAAAALLAAGRTASIQSAIPLAQAAIDSGMAMTLCERLKSWTNR